MADDQTPNTTAMPELPSDDQLLAKARNYQVEMLEESLKKNIIVAMDTGSGKTHIAVMRIRAELDKGNKKISWFLCPGVDLARQQFQVLRDSLPPVHMQFLVGASGVDHWSNQEVWDTVLMPKDPNTDQPVEGEAVIVSTHQVLADALYHGFVSMDRIGLLVFDEAHHCVQSHPSRKIMELFYHPRLEEGRPVPSILGLTASPVMKADPRQLGKIESNLNAIARTPIAHREELTRYVHVPRLRIAYYRDDTVEDPFEKSLAAAKPQPTQLVPESWASHLDCSLNMDFDLGAPLQFPGFGSAGPVDQGTPFPFSFRSPGPVDRGAAGSLSTLDEPQALRSNEQHKPPTQPKPPSSSSDYETIDPKTGEPVTMDVDSDDEFECIDPTTGDLVEGDERPTDGGIASGSPGDFEEINPISGDPILPPDPIGLPKSSKRSSRALNSLCAVYVSMEMKDDPYVIKLRNSGCIRKRAQAERLVISQRTYCQEQMKQLVNKAMHLLDEYGEWAADWFVREAIHKFLKQDHFLDEESDDLDEADADEEVMDADEEVMEADGIMDEDEQQYLRALMKTVVLPELGPVETLITAKVEKLIAILLEEYYAEKSHGDFSGLVFVEQRAGVLALAKILQVHPKTKAYFRPGTMVGGSSSNRGLRFLRDLAGKGQENTLNDFRAGKKNLIVATAVIEEGLDVQDCHLVICFYPPRNLKSFVQRRGRARRANSSYVIMYPDWAVGTTKAEEFEALEDEMIKYYSDPLREIGDMPDYSIEEVGAGRCVKIESTGALLTLDNSVPHLYHFCACLPAQEFVDLRPDFRLSSHTTEQNFKVWTAEVVLPNSIHPDIRRFRSTKTWNTEKWATRDAAFEAFLKLHSLGQVDDNLMPLVKRELQSLQEAQKRAPRATVEHKLDIWRLIGENWATAEQVYVCAIEMAFSSGTYVAVDMLLPIPLPEIEDLQLYWTLEEVVEVKFTRSKAKPLAKTPQLLARARNATFRLLNRLHSRRMANDQHDFTYLFLPREGSGETWDQSPEATISALEAYHKKVDMGVIHDHEGASGTGARYVFERWRTDIDPCELSNHLHGDLAHQPVLEATRLTKRRDFLHKEAGQRKSEKTVLLLPSAHDMDTLPLRYAQLALLLPFALDRVGKSLLAEEFKRNMKMEWLPTNLMVHAITASSARDPVDYQRLEFLGDSTLKILTTVHLVDENPLWHEGYLAGAKDRIVSNTTSSKAAIAARLSRWIITKPFTGVKWGPRYIHDSENANRNASDTKLLSTKVLADIVEAFIGVGYLTRGYEGATACCSCFDFGHEVVWKPFKDRIQSFVATAEQNAKRFDGRYSNQLSDLETYFGYKFKNKALLLEALTHLSHGGDSVSTSYQRLEFLGDSVLDMVVVNKLFHFPGKKLSHIDMHHLKSACVNAGFLAFLCMGAVVRVVSSDTPQGKTTKLVKQPRHLYKYLRHSNAEITLADSKCFKRYRQLKKTISEQLETAPEYPWTDLTKLDAPKHLSDIVESLIAALWVDSNGDFGLAERFIEKLGILKVLDRLVVEGVEADHPMSRFGKYVAGGGKHGLVKYHTEVVERDGRTTVDCAIEVNEQPIVKVEGGATSQHAKTWAAQLALGILMEAEEQKAKETAEKAKEGAGAGSDGDGGDDGDGDDDGSEGDDGSESGDDGESDDEGPDEHPPAGPEEHGAVVQAEGEKSDEDESFYDAIG